MENSFKNKKNVEQHYLDVEKEHFERDMFLYIACKLLRIFKKKYITFSNFSSFIEF